MKKHIEKVSIIRTVIRHDEKVVPCLAVVIDQMPEDESEIVQIGDDIRAVVFEYNRK